MASVNRGTFDKYKILAEIGKGGKGLMEQNMKVIMRLLVGFFLAISAYSQSADLILLNAKVFTGNPDKPRAEAVAIHGKRILAVGENVKIRRLADSKTRVIDLRGRTVIPGINDAHVHFMPKPAGYTLGFKSMEPSFDETVNAIESAVQIVPKGGWIFGTIGSVVMGDMNANRIALDRIAPNQPVMLETFYGHGMIVNSKAMGVLGIKENRLDSNGGFFERDAKTGNFNGRIFEYPQWRQNRVLANKVSDDDAIKKLQQMANTAARFGITTLQIMPMTRIEKFVSLLEKADLPVRVNAIAFLHTTADKGRDISEILDSRNPTSSSPRVTQNGIKWILDGTPIERGAAQRQPYFDSVKTRGKLNFPEKEIEKMLRESIRYEKQILLHAAGDRAIELVLASMEKMKGVNWRKKRVRIEHGDGLLPDLVRRAKKLGIIIVQNPSHFNNIGGLDERFPPGHKRFPVRSLIESKIPFAIGSDGPLNPFLNIMFASIHLIRPAEAISREDAVRAYTYGSAFAERAENNKGTLEKGKLADLAVLSQDIFRVKPNLLPATQSVLTIVGGKIVYGVGAVLDASKKESK